MTSSTVRVGSIRALTVIPSLVETVLVGTNWLLDCGPLGVEGVRGVLGDELMVDMELPVRDQVNKMVGNMADKRGSESVGHIVKTDRSGCSG